MASTSSTNINSSRELLYIAGTIRLYLQISSTYLYDSMGPLSIGGKNSMNLCYKSLMLICK